MALSFDCLHDRDRLGGRAGHRQEGKPGGKILNSHGSLHGRVHALDMGAGPTEHALQPDLVESSSAGKVTPSATDLLARALWLQVSESANPGQTH